MNNNSQHMNGTFRIGLIWARWVWIFSCFAIFPMIYAIPGIVMAGKCQKGEAPSKAPVTILSITTGLPFLLLLIGKYQPINKQANGNYQQGGGTYIPSDPNAPLDQQPQQGNVYQQSPNSVVQPTWTPDKQVDFDNNAEKENKKKK